MARYHRVLRAALRGLAAHELEAPDRDRPVERQLCDQRVEAAERPRLLLPFHATEREVGVEGARLPLEPELRQPPLDVLLETPEGGSRFDAQPKHAWAPHARERAEPTEVGREAGTSGGDPREDGID